MAVLGAGAWGRTLAQLASKNIADVRVWSRQGDLAIADAIAESDLLVSAISMNGVPSTIARVQAYGLPDRCAIVSATKGLDSVTLKTPSQLWQEAFPQHAVVVLSGPNLSKEISNGLPAATVAASREAIAADITQWAFASERFRVYTNADPIGTELGGTLKNVMAIAVGVCDGLQLGTNAKSALITRGLAEMLRIGLHFGAQAETFSGLSGLGDLLATCSSMLSRNYQVGYNLAKGRSLNDILATLEGTAEGVNTAGVMVDLANREQLSIPITRQVHKLLLGRDTPQAAVEALMERELKPETCELL
ncbi:MAG: NAD(P)H-dependent glycerol-3-phosphate dehydrogenase [Synechococcus sp.]